MKLMQQIKEFLGQDDYFDAFITGPAGSGKTTVLKKVIDYLNTTDLNYIVTAYTHKAKDVLASKLPKDTNISTLHSFLKKRPGINKNAKHIKQLQITTQLGKPAQLDLIIVDEFSFIGEKDAISLQELQDPVELELYRCKQCGKEFTELYANHKCECGGVDYDDLSLNPVKILYVGDLNQLSPIHGPSYIEPYEPYWVRLTKIYRNDFPQLQELVKFIEGEKKPYYLEPSENFQRKINIDKAYKESKTEDKIMLAYTNKAVQRHNAIVHGRRFPVIGDEVYISSLKKVATVIDMSDEFLGEVITPTGAITPSTKYNPLKFLNDNKNIKFFHTTVGVVAGIFGSYNNKKIREAIANRLVDANRKKKDSSKAYREYKNINDYTCIIDFNHCMTVHKSQGSEFEEVYIDITDFSHCIDSTERLKLLYVAMSRAKMKIFLNF